MIARTSSPLSRAVLKSKTDLAEDLVQLLTQRWRTCRKKLERLEDNRHNGEDVHQARVTARRLISILDVVIALTQDKTLAKARKGIKRQFSLFSPVRDADVQCGHLHELSARFPQVDPFYRALLKRKKNLTAQARRALAVPGKLPRKIQKRLVARLREHLFLAQEIFSQIKAAHDKVLKTHQGVKAESPPTLHRLRVAFKKFRYSAAAVQNLLPVVSAPALGRMRIVQARLGEIQDLAVFKDRLNKLAAKKLHRFAEELEPVLKALTAEETQKITALIPELDRMLVFKLRDPSA